MKRWIAVLFFSISVSPLAKAYDNPHDWSCERLKGQRDLPAQVSLHLQNGIMIFNGIKFVNHTIYGHWDTGHYFTSTKFPGTTIQFAAGDPGLHMMGWSADPDYGGRQTILSYQCMPAPPQSKPVRTSRASPLHNVSCRKCPGQADFTACGHPDGRMACVSGIAVFLDENGRVLKGSLL